MGLRRSRVHHYNSSHGGDAMSIYDPDFKYINAAKSSRPGYLRHRMKKIYAKAITGPQRVIRVGLPPSAPEKDKNVP